MWIVGGLIAASAFLFLLFISKSSGVPIPFGGKALSVFSAGFFYLAWKASQKKIEK